MTIDSEFIRAFKSDDLERIAEIYDLSHPMAFMGELTEFSHKCLMDNPTSLGTFYDSDVFVFDEAGIKGFVVYKGGIIIWLYIDPEYQRQKIGRRLIEFVMRRLSMIVGILVLKSNQPALSLYSDLGFKVLDEFEFDYQGELLTALSLVSETALQFINKPQR
uniref:GNAT family N-acetyltransferase n=1 Tax=uncultured Thiotrichaceae bacterium TaxID=298394 RepID=A0A6S6UB14_9GAMM|nr:MAG: GNAT family N-acetyltransferase [uncultured Thiotrichaceae bacterium]